MDAIRKLLSTIKIKIDGVEWPNSYGDDIQIDRTNLEAEFTNQPGRFAYYATLAEMADATHLRLKEELEALSAAVDAENRTKAAALQEQNPKFKMTEAMYEHQILLDPRYKAKLEQVQEARTLAKLLHHAPKAFEHRKDMIVQMGANLRQSTAEPRVNQREQVRDNLAGKSPMQRPPDNEAPPRWDTPIPGKICGMCREPVFPSNSGPVCRNGHGGAEVDAPPPGPAPQAAPEQPPAPPAPRARRTATIPAGLKCPDCQVPLSADNTSRLPDGTLVHVQCPSKVARPKCDQQPDYCCLHKECKGDKCCEHGTPKPWWETNLIADKVCGSCGGDVYKTETGPKCKKGHNNDLVPREPAAAPSTTEPNAATPSRRRPSRSA